MDVGRGPPDVRSVDDFMTHALVDVRPSLDLLFVFRCPLVPKQRSGLQPRTATAFPYVPSQREAVRDSVSFKGTRVRRQPTEPQATPV